ncbi:hypothetical protein NM688_g2239 [Phlebia brevispora]|uniref:Uncharacterized protein n=1 Tax=Phlebia brevispora TaxID=194682 RepID=A0ACC1T929_9APHY|nr:hypothetical protein NM688_g2239 [Phlebia brevispora]
MEECSVITLTFPPRPPEKSYHAGWMVKRYAYASRQLGSHKNGYLPNDAGERPPPAFVNNPLLCPMGKPDDPLCPDDEESAVKETIISSINPDEKNRTEEGVVQSYSGNGTLEDPYVVDWDPGDPENPYNWSKRLQMAIGTFTVSFCSSSYTGGLASIMKELHMSHEVAILGVSLFVLGFGLGPLVFAPLGELYGRRIVFLTTYAIFTLFHLGGALGHNTATLLSTRLLAGIFGSSLYATAPFMGPVLGPIVSGWIVETRLGWRFNFWIMFMLSSFSLIFGFLVTSETFAPALLRWRARKLTKASAGKAYFISIHDLKRSASFIQVLKFNLKRPFVFLAFEPIVLLLALYIAIVYATLYAFFAAFPIVFQDTRHFSPGEGGLAFLGVGIGTAFGTALAPLNNKLYYRDMRRSGTGKAPPESRLYMPMVGAIILPAGLFWFAWTCEPPVFWLAPIAAGVPFGTGLAQIMQGLVQYLMDTYTIYCASAIASTVILRSILAAVFPLISPFMYANLGNSWATMVFAFLSVTCTPLPFLFFRYGPWIRSKSRFASGHDRIGILARAVSPSATLHDKEKGIPNADEKEKTMV